jgi:DNA primase
MVNAEKQIFHCFGCGAGGDIFTFIMKKENLEFREALEILAKRAGVELKQERPEDRSERERLRNIQAEALRYFQTNLKKSQRARQYLEKRGVMGESMEVFSLGYTPRGWHLLIDHLKKKGFSTEVMIKAGVAASGQKGPYDIFRERIIFPIFDLHGAPVAFGGRVMDDTMPKYLNSPDTPLFRKGDTLYALGEAREEIRAKGYTVVVEGYLDAIMCHQYGVRNVVAPLGTALTGAHLRKLSPLARNILLVFDGDEAGVAAARRSLEMALEGGLRGKVLVLPPGEDPDSILSTKGAGHFMELMGRASTPVEFMLSGRGTSGQEGVRQTLALAANVPAPGKPRSGRYCSATGRPAASRTPHAGCSSMMRKRCFFRRPFPCRRRKRRSWGEWARRTWKTPWSRTSSGSSPAGSLPRSTSWTRTGRLRNGNW